VPLANVEKSCIVKVIEYSKLFALVLKFHNLSDVCYLLFVSCLSVNYAFNNATNRKASYHDLSNFFQPRTAC
jgi:hypothetical protein